MKESVFNQNSEEYTGLAMKIDDEFHHVLKPIFQKYMDKVPVRELFTLALHVANNITITAVYRPKEIDNETKD